MKTLCIKTRAPLDLLNAQLSIDGCSYTVVGLAKEEYYDGQFWQWWILMEDENEI